MANDSSVAQGEAVSLVDRLAQYVAHLTFRLTHGGNVTGSLPKEEQDAHRTAAQEMVDGYIKANSTEYISDQVGFAKAIDRIVEKLANGCPTICANQTDAEEIPVCRKHAVMRLAELIVHKYSLENYFGDDKLTPLTWADSLTSYRKQA